MPDYFHLWIFEKNPSLDLIKFDLDRDALMTRVVDRYHQGKEIVLGGTSVRPENIARITIVTTREPSTEFLPKIENSLNQRKVFGSTTLLHREAIKYAQDVTDNFIVAAPGEMSHLSNTSRADPHRVFVVHGQDEKAKQALFTFLRSVSLDPIEWLEAKSATKKASPYIGEILNEGFKMAQAAIILLTPDENVYLRKELRSDPDSTVPPLVEQQSRPNVFIELGMALGMKPDQTVIVEMGRMRPASDLIGRHTVRLDNSAQRRQELLSALETAGCQPNTLHKSDWFTAGDLTPTKGDFDAK